MPSVLTIAGKDLRLLWRDRAGLFWVLFFPLAMAILFGAMFGSDDGPASGLKVSVVDEDGTVRSRAFVSQLEKNDALIVSRARRAEAADAVRRGKLVAYIVLRKGFGESFALFGGDDSPLEVGIDPARKAESGYLQGILMQEAFLSLRDRFSDPAEMRRKVEESIADIEYSSPGLDAAQRTVLLDYMKSTERFLDQVEPEVYKSAPAFGKMKSGIKPVAVETQEEGPRSPWDISFPSAMMWALIGCVATFAISTVKERTEGTWLRLRIAPVSRAAVLGGKAAACFFTCIAVISALLLIGVFFFHLRISSPLLLAAAVLSTAACFTGMMMLLSVAGKSERAVAGAGWGVMMFMAMFGGGMVPLFFMPGWMQAIGTVSPVKWGILAIEGAIWRGFGPSEMLLPCGVLIGVGSVFFAASVFVLRRMDR